MSSESAHTRRTDMLVTNESDLQEALFRDRAVTRDESNSEAALSPLED